MAETRPIIIKKKKGGHAGHHGGAWKVAYADFVTAMMALFIVLWLMNTSKPVKEAVSGYFKDPLGTANKVGSGQTGSGESFALTKDNMDQLKEELQKAVRAVDKFDKLKDQIEMTVTSEGLRIELLENEAGTFFPSGVATPTEDGRDILIKLSEELKQLPNKISIEGHTDARPFAANAQYGNWELSTDRGNAARRIMQQAGIGSHQITQVRGYADQQLRKADAPEDPSNRRISLIVQYRSKDGEAPSGPSGGKPEAGHGPEGKPAPAAPVATPNAAPAAPAKTAPVAPPNAAPATPAKTAPVAPPKPAPATPAKTAPVAPPKPAPTAPAKTAPVATPKPALAAPAKTAPVAPPKPAPAAPAKTAPAKGSLAKPAASH